jgi:hypothetical protein
MKKLFSFLLSLMLLFSNPIFAAWDKSLPAGSTNLSDLDTVIGANNTALENSLLQMRGWVNLSVAYASSATVTVTADHLWLQGSATIPYLASTVSETINITSSGAGGLDTGSEAISTWYYIWVIAKADGTVDGLLSASATSPTMPTDYVYKTLVSAVRNDSSENFIPFTQTGKKYAYTTWQTIASGNVGAGSWTSIDTTTFVPSTLSNYCFGLLAGAGNGALTNNSSMSVTATTFSSNKNNPRTDTNGQSFSWEFDIATANTLYWVSDNASSYVYLHGFDINKL